MPKEQPPKNVDDYIKRYPKEIQAFLKQMRKIIQEAAPDATETISYSMPAYKQDGIVVWFAAATTHIGFYPKASGIEAFKDKLKAYKTSKGTIQFPFTKPLPVTLIQEIVRYRVKENQAGT